MTALRGIPALILLGLLAIGCTTPTATVILRGGPMSLSGDFGASQGPVSARASADALGLDSAEVTFQPRVDVDWSAWHLSASGFGAKYRGDGVADARLEGPGGGAIEDGVKVDSEVDVSMISADFAYDLIPWDWMDIGIGAGLGALAFRAEVSAKNAPVTAGIDESTPMGYLLLRLAKTTRDFKVVLRLAGISASFENDEVRYFDADLMGAVRLFGEPATLQGDLVLGYRYLKAEYDHRSGSYRFETDPTIQGPYLGLGLVF